MSDHMSDRLGHIGVLMGGYSSEREISLKSGKAIVQALKAAGLKVSAIDILDRDEKRIEAVIRQHEIDIAFIALHGQLGEDGVIQNILERLGIVYTGSGVVASQSSINKGIAQTLFMKNGIRIPKHYVIEQNKTINFDDVLKIIGQLPFVIKPACEGSSIGITLVRNQQEFLPSLEKAFEYGHEVVIEEFIKGRECTVGILGTEVLPVIEICSKEPFFDFNAKYQSKETQYIVPAQLSKKIVDEMNQMALKAFHVLGCSNLARIDFMLSDKEVPYVLEINTIPGFTATSLLPKAAKQLGYDFTQLCIKILELAYGKKKTGQRTTVSH